MTEEERKRLLSQINIISLDDTSNEANQIRARVNQQDQNFFADTGRAIESLGAGISSSLANLGKGTLIGARNIGLTSTIMDKVITDLRDENKLEEIKTKAKEQGMSTTTLDEYINQAKNTKTSLENIEDFSEAVGLNQAQRDAQKRILELQNETESEFAKKVIGFMPNLAQQAVTMGASLINPALGSAVATGQAMGSYYDDAKSRGMTPEQANDFATTMGAIEGVTEILEIDNFLKAGKGAKALAKGGWKEAKKELSKEVIKSTFGHLTSGAMSNFMQEALTEPIQEGFADLYGKGKGNWENIEQRMLEAGINGAISSLIMGGAHIGVQTLSGISSKSQDDTQLTPEQRQAQLNQDLIETFAELEKLSPEEKQEFIDKYVTPGIKTAQDVARQQIEQEQNEPKSAVPMQTSENVQQQVQEQEQQVIPNQNENALNQKVEPQNLVESAERSGIDVKDEKTRKNLEVIQKFNEKRGIKATFDADAFKGHDNINSFFRTDENGNREIVFNPNTMTDKTIQQLAVHEVYHDMVAGGTAQELTDFVIQKMSNNPEYQEYVRALQDVYEEQDSDIIKEEAVAHYLEKNLGTNEFISELQERGDRTTIQRIIDTIKDMITKAKNTLTGKGDLNYLLDLQRKYEQAYRGEFKGTQEQTKLSKQVNEDRIQNHKEKQLEIIQETNPMWDEEHVGIRKADDIKTFEQCVNDAREDNAFEWGDYTKEDAERDLKNGKVTIYSSYPIKNGVFVSTSYQQAYEYAGHDASKVHQRTVNLDSVAWINGDEGQYAKVKPKVDATKVENQLVERLANNLQVQDKTSDIDIHSAARRQANREFDNLETDADYDKFINRVSELENKIKEKLQISDQPNIDYESPKNQTSQIFSKYQIDSVVRDIGVERYRNFTEQHNSDFNDTTNPTARYAEINGELSSDYYDIDGNLVKLTTTKQGDNLYIDELYVEKQKQGTGTKVVKMLQDYADKAGLTLKTSDELEQAKGFWDKVLNRQQDTTRFSKEAPTKDNQGRELSKGQQERLKNTKAVDEDGNVLELYHFTPSGDFTIFDKTRANPESDMGAGFYFTNSEIDGQQNYQDENGADIRNRIDRLAEQIESEEDITYEEAREKAEQQVLQGGSSFNVYLDIENPAYIGGENETRLFTQDDIREYAEENDLGYDFENEEDAYDNALADYVENITNDLYDTYSFDEVQQIQRAIYDAIYENDFEGINVQQLKDKLNDPDNFIEIYDDNGNLVTNEIARQIVENIGYDGIIDNTVSSKFNMNLDPDTTHYIVFRPEQIKNVTNLNPTDNPDINLSKQGTGTSQDTINNFLEKTKVNEGTGTAIKDLARVQEETTEPVRQVAPSEAPAQVPQVNEVKQRQVEPIRDITDVERPQVPQNQKARKTYESIINSNQMTQEAKQIARELMGYDTYEPQTNKLTLAVADKNIEQNGVNESLTTLTNKVNNNDKISAVDIAMGERLIQYYSKTGDRAKLQEAIQTTAMAGTEAGRAVQAMAMLNHQTPTGQVTWIQRSIDKVNKRLAKEGKPQFNFTPEMQQKILNSTQENLQKNLDSVYRELGQQVPKSAMEKFNEWRYFSMLFNPKTHIRNILGNVVMGYVQRAKNKIAGTIEDFVIGDNAERWNSLKGASKGMYEFAKNDLKNADVQSMLGLNENKYNPQSRLQQNQRTFKNKFLEGTLGKLFDLNSKALEVEDGWGLKSGYAKAMANYLNANNLDYTNLTDTQLQKARQYAVEQAKEATFHQDNSIANMLQTLENKNLFTKVALGGAIPFKKTPMNVALTGFEYSPAGFAKTLTTDLINLRKGKISANQFIDNISKNLTGTAISILGYGLTQAGILKASGSGDEDKDEFEEATGKQNYSIQIGDKTYSLDWLTPAGIPLFIGSELYQVSHKQEEGNKTKNENEAFKSITKILDATASAMNPMSEMTMISGLTNALKSYAQGSTKSIENMLANVGKSYATQAVPTALGQIARSTDQYERSTTSTETDPMAKAIDSAKNQIISKIPGLRETLPVSTDVWGNARETQSYEENAILPWTSKEISKDPVNKALTDLYDATGESGVLPDNYIDKSLTIDKEKYKLTNEEYARLKQQYGKTAHDILSDLTKSKEYEQMSDEQKVKAVKEAYSYAKSTLKVTYSDENNLDAEESSTYKKVQSVIDNGGDAKEYFEYTGLIDGVKKEKEKRQILLNSNIKDKGAIYESTIGSDDETYQIMKATGIDPDAYLEYKQQDFSSDKEDDGTIKGKTVSGSGKTKFYDYMDNANMTYEQKLLLTGMKYKLLPGERDTLANYIDTLPISASEKTDIYKKLKGATVYQNGEIYY